MVLLPLEFSECYIDSPWFRENIQHYEEELERTNSQIKQLIKDAKNMLHTFKTQEKSMKTFNDRLQKFQFDCIGETLTDDEKMIAGSLKEFGLMLGEVSSEWGRTIERAQLQLIKPLEAFRKEHIYSFRESKKLFEKASDRYYKQLENNLSLSHKKKEQQLHDSDSDLYSFRKLFHKESLRYVYKLQEVQERKKFEFVEHLLMFMQVYFNYFHQTHETANDYKDYMKELQIRLVATRDRYDGTKTQTESLMRKMEEKPDSSLSYGDRWSRVGYLFLMEKNTISSRLGSRWTKHFCMYRKENKLFQMMSHSHGLNVVASSIGSKVTSSNLHPSNNGTIDAMIVKTCTRRITDTIDKRFCFDLEVEDTGPNASGKVITFTFQAVSDEDRKKWMSVMDGKEPVHVPSKVYPNKKSTMTLDETGVKFVEKLICEIERRGVEHHGIYRLVGVMSKVDNLLSKGLNSETASSINLADVDSWEMNTLTSALKSYLRNLPEPLMTFELHRVFIDAAKKDVHADRVTSIVSLVSKLPQINHQLLSILVKHLGKVQEQHEQNKMTVQNLGVCFGPTLMRDNMETVQAIIDIKFSNIIVEILIEERNTMFSKSSNAAGKSEDLPSPRNKLTVRPSLRMKQRPHGGFYEQSENMSGFGDVDNDFKSRPVRSSRSGAFVSDHGQTISSQDGQSASPLSSVSDDGYGHISPIGDLDLDLEDLTNDVADPPHISDATPSTAISTVASKQEQTIAANNQNPDAEQPDASHNGNQSNDTTSQSNENRKLTRSSAKQNMSLRKKFKVSLKSKQTETIANQNNNNNRQRPTRDLKPRNLNLSNSIKEARKKFSVLENLASPKSNPKKFLSPVNETTLSFSNASNPSSPEDSSHSTRLRTHHIGSIYPNQGVGDSDTSRKSSQGDDIDDLHTLEPQRFGTSIKQAVVAVLPVQEADNSKETLRESGDFSKTSKVTSTEGTTLFACRGDQLNELSFQAGERVYDIKNSDEDGWLVGSIDGRCGLIPKNYVQFL